MATTHYELYGWPRTKWERGDFFAERRLICYWADRTDVLVYLDSNPRYPVEYGAGPVDAAGNSTAMIRSAEVFPFPHTQMLDSGYDDIASYEYAMIVCKYDTIGPILDSQNRWIEERISIGGQNLQVDEKYLRWEDGIVVDPNDAPTNDQGLVEYNLAFYNLYSLPTWVLTRPGCCNSNVFVTAGLGIWFAAETLKYQGCDIVGKYSLGRYPRYSLFAHFLHKGPGWNKFWRPNSGGGSWERMKTKNGDYYVQHPPVVMDLL